MCWHQQWRLRTAFANCLRSSSPDCEELDTSRNGLRAGFGREGHGPHPLSLCPCKELCVGYGQQMADIFAQLRCSTDITFERTQLYTACNRLDMMKRRNGSHAPSLVEIKRGVTEFSSLRYV